MTQYDKPAPESAFDSRDFYELMQSYRHTPTTALADTVDRFEEVKDYCKLHAAPQPVIAPEWVMLTDDEIQGIHVKAGSPRAIHIEFARAIEAAFIAKTCGAA